MYPRLISAVAFASVLLAVAPQTSHAVNRCVVQGAVTFQQGPCPVEGVRRDPTLEELNAAERRKRAASATAPSSATGGQRPSPAQAAGPAPRFRCDGRQRCPQMTSCEEAKFFLANCPGVSMDGDRDGIPCEQQWCSSR